MASSTTRLDTYVLSARINSTNTLDRTIFNGKAPFDRIPIPFSLLTRRYPDMSGFTTSTKVETIQL